MKKFLRFLRIKSFLGYYEILETLKIDYSDDFSKARYFILDENKKFKMWMIVSSDNTYFVKDTGNEVKFIYITKKNAEYTIQNGVRHGMIIFTKDKTEIIFDKLVTGKIESFVYSLNDILK